MHKKQLIISWIAGAVLISGVFYAAVAWLWTAVAESHAASVETQVVSALSNDLAEGNLFKLGVTLSKLKRDGLLRFAEIRQLGKDGGNSLVYRTQGGVSPTGEYLAGFSCGERRQLEGSSHGGVSLITTLPSNSLDVSCSTLFITSDLPRELNLFKSRLIVSFGGLLVVLFGAFFWLTIYWYRKILALETSNVLMRVEKDVEMGRMVSQLAHDIRSPLAALGAAAKGLDIPQEQRSMIDGAVARMQGIADDLLARYRAPSSGPAKPRTSVLALGGLVEQVVAEKRLQHNDKPGVSIDFAVGSADIKASVEPTEFQRLVSNLINNSVEAFSGPGAVMVALSALDHKVLLTVKDNGKGIPPEILARLGQKGETHGKAGGTGLGVYHARKTVESWGGSFKIESEAGKGTAVTLELPAAAVKPVPARAVLLDDDLLVHMNWRMAAKAAGVELKAYKTPGELIADAEALPKDTPIYVDSELGADVKGEDTAQALHDKGFTDLTMATGHAPEKFSRLPWLKVTGKEPPWN